ncbi:MAG TPA: alpha/beta fold hydrolase [Caulobacteraceae bacterium]|nr:alpha/beta fold hydrolase [Caulobacteraceae bacterium]
MSAAEQQTVPRGLTAEVAEGRLLRYVLAGPAASPRPLVVLEAGSFGFSADWAAVQAKLAAEGLRSLAYDRAGLGVSDPGSMPRDSNAIVSDLEVLLATIDEGGPCIVCGHSMAGMHVRLFADRNAAQVRGVVLVDATTPEAMDLPAAAHLVGQFANLSKLAAWGAAIGIQRPLAGALGDAIGLPAVAKEEKRRAFADPVHNRWAAAEVEAWHADAAEARAAGPFDPAWPVAVVLTGDGRQPLARHAVQTAPANASRHGFVIHVPGSNHASLLGERHAGHIVRAILQVEAAAKT